MRILCLDIPAPGTSLEKYAPHLNAEALHAWGLYKSGFIRDIYFRQDRPGVAIFLECDSVDEAMNVMAEFPLSMTEISLAWLLTKVTSPVVGAAKKDHVDGAVNAVNLQLSPEEIRFLEETYQPHILTGIMAQNTPQTKDARQVWTR
ncbi:aldo/keto reductase [Citrobacter braakii]|uniref:aldo/keto reductase n=1 Tax=Citrobacter braakii TaxID=57706 RepID=UPI0035245D3A